MSENNKSKFINGKVVKIVPIKSGEHAIVDIGQKFNGFVNVEEFKYSPVVGETYAFKVIGKHGGDGDLIQLERASVERRILQHKIKQCISNMDPLSCVVKAEIPNGYKIHLTEFNLKGILVTKEKFEVGQTVDDVLIVNGIYNKFADIKCMLKAEKSNPVQIGDVIKGRISVCNDIFATIVSDALPSNYEISANIRYFKHDLSKSSEEMSFVVRFCDGFNVFVGPTAEESVEMEKPSAAPEVKIDEIYSGKVKFIGRNGICVKLNQGIECFVGLSEIGWSIKSDHQDEFKVGQEVKVKILSINNDDNRIRASIRRNGEMPNYFNQFTREYKVGDRLDVKIVEIENKDDKFIVFVHPVKMPNFYIVLPPFVSRNARNAKVGDTLNISIISINERDYKIIPKINPKMRVPKFVTCKVTSVKNGVMHGCIFDVERQHEGAPVFIRLSDDTANANVFAVGDIIKCKVRRSEGGLVVFPIDYNVSNSDSDKEDDGSLGDLFSNL